MLQRLLILVMVRNNPSQSPPKCYMNHHSAEKGAFSCLYYYLIYVFLFICRETKVRSAPDRSYLLPLNRLFTLNKSSICSKWNESKQRKTFYPELVVFTVTAIPIGVNFEMSSFRWRETNLLSVPDWSHLRYCCTDSRSAGLQFCGINEDSNSYQTGATGEYLII